MAPSKKQPAAAATAASSSSAAKCKAKQMKKTALPKTPPKQHKKPAASAAAAAAAAAAPFPVTRAGPRTSPPVAAFSRLKKKAVTWNGGIKLKAPLKQQQKKAPKKKKEEERCLICLETLPPLEKRGLRSAGVVGIGAGCEHEFCQPCLSQYCKTALAENKGLETGGALPCPAPRCFKKGKGKGGQGGGEMGPGEVKALVGEAAWAKHKERAKAHQLEMSTRTRFCPRVKCGAVNRLPIDATGRATCVKCKKDFCAGVGCGLLPHPGKTCEQAGDAAYGKWKGKNTVKACPKCRHHIEKNGGCNHMKCIKCKIDFCWNCSKSYVGTNACTCHSNFYYPAFHYAPAAVQAQPAPAAMML